MLSKILFVIIISSEILFGQISIKDKENLMGIPFVALYDEQENLISISDENGTLSLNIIKNKNLKVNDLIKIKHLSYETKYLNIQNLYSSSDILLDRKSISLPEILITSKSSFNYIKLKGYYRSYSIIENELSEYMDGIIEIYFPKTTDQNILFNRVQERAMSRKVKSNDVDFLVCTPAIPDFNYSNIKPKTAKNYHNKFDKEYFLNNHLDKKIKVSKQYQKNNSQMLLQNVSFVSAENPKTYTFMGNKSKMEYHNESSLYNCLDSNDISLTNLIHHKEIRKYYYKRKIDDKFYGIELLSEFFVESIEYLDDKPKKLSSFIGFKKISNYSDYYWEKYNSNNSINKLPEFIDNELKLSFSEYPKINK
jgi:hypothetical protein